MTTLNSNLANEIFSPLPDNGIAAVTVGATYSFVPTIAISATYAIVRKPSSSAATLSSGSITTDVAGLYVINVTNGSITRAVNLVACPSGLSAFKTPAGNAILPAVVASMLAQNVGQWSPATFAATVESAGAAQMACSGFNTALIGSSAPPATAPGIAWGNFAN